MGFDGVFRRRACAAYYNFETYPNYSFYGKLRRRNSLNSQVPVTPKRTSAQKLSLWRTVVAVRRCATQLKWYSLRDSKTTSLAPLWKICGARIQLADLLEIGGQLAITTDSYVVDPIIFPGGNIDARSYWDGE